MDAGQYTIFLVAKILHADYQWVNNRASGVSGYSFQLQWGGPWAGRYVIEASRFASLLDDYVRLASICRRGRQRCRRAARRIEPDALTRWGPQEAFTARKAPVDAGRHLYVKNRIAISSVPASVRSRGLRRRMQPRGKSNAGTPVPVETAQKRFGRPNLCLGF